MNSLPFSLLSDEPNDESQTQADQHAQFRRPQAASASPAPCEKPLANTCPDAQNDALTPIAGQNEDRWKRPNTDHAVAWASAPLQSVLPTPICAEPQANAASAEKQKSKPRSEPRLWLKKRVTLDLQTPATACKTEQQAQREQAKEVKSARSAPKAGSLVAAAAVLLVAVLCVDHFLMPLIHYRKALRAEADGNFEQAAALFGALGDYEDSAKHLDLLPHEKAAALMNQENYQEALELLENAEQEDPLLADCIYALAVTAYNDGDLETSLQYLDQLQARFPDYSKAGELKQMCNYSLGSRYSAELSALSQPEEAIYCLEKTIAAFEKANGYADAGDQLKSLRYNLAQRLIGDQPWQDSQKAVSLLSALADYRDSARLRLDAMYEYVSTHFMESNVPSMAVDYDGFYDYSVKYDDEVLHSYLAELAANGFEDAQTLLDRLNGVGFSIALYYGLNYAPLPKVVTDLSKVSVICEFPKLKQNQPLQPALSCFLSDGSSTTRSMWYIDSDTVNIRLSDALGTLQPEGGEITLYDVK